MNNKLIRYLVLLSAIVLVMAVIVPSVSAYQGEVIKVKAHVVAIPGNATSSPGWWQTHPAATQWILDNKGPIDIGWPAIITTNAELMGVFWSNNAFDTNPDDTKGAKRESLCKAKAQASFQVLAAFLNTLSPKGASLPMNASQIRAIMSGTDEVAIKNLIEILSSYNNSGEGLSLGLPESCMGHADPGAAQSMANEAFANCR